MSRQIEMTWRCSTCSRSNLGRNMVCTGCGDPKDASEHYEMPSNTAVAPSVTDPALLRIATAGPNWRCTSCGSDQRRTDGNCVQCGDRPRPRSTPRPAAPQAAYYDIPLERVFAIGLVIAVAVLAIAAVVAWVGRERTYDAHVTAVHWEQRILVERYQIYTREGWRDDVSRDAFDIESLGQQFHHHEQVFDGYDAERYTDQVACGQDCRQLPEHCSESCTPNGNGFATCRTTCSGGGQSCETRYCTEWKIRHVPRYRSEPRYAERIRYRIWDWGHARTVSASGDDVDDVHWPEGGAMAEALPTGERERETRFGDYWVTLTYDDEQVTIEADADTFGNFAVGSEHVVTTHFRSLTVDGAPAKRVED